MKNKLKNSINKIKLPSVYLSVRSKIRKPWGIIMVYHRVDYNKSYPWAMPPVSPTDFEAQLDFLCRNYEIVSINELIKRKLQHGSFSKKLAVITFDDGFKDNYTVAYPILKRRSLPASIFITTSRIENYDLFWSDKINYACWKTSMNRIQFQDLGEFIINGKTSRIALSEQIKSYLKSLGTAFREEKVDEILDALKIEIPPNLNRGFMLSWDNIREMSNNGITFGAHTVSHNSLTEYSLKDAEREIVLSKKEMEKKLGLEVSSFSYPYGQMSDYNQEIKDLVKKYGYQCAVTTNFGLVTSKSDPYELPRISGSNIRKFYLQASAMRNDYKYFSDKLKGIL